MFWPWYINDLLMGIFFLIKLISVGLSVLIKITSIDFIFTLNPCRVEYI